MKLKQMGIALIAAGVLSANVYANEAGIEQISVQPQGAFTETDLATLFEQDAKPMQLAALSAQEMRETEGALAPWIVGGLGGAAWQGANYAWGAYRGNYAWNTNRFIGNVASGAMIGAGAGQLRFLASGVTGIRNLATPGGAIWAANGATMNWGVNHIWRR